MTGAEGRRVIGVQNGWGREQDGEVEGKNEDGSVGVHACVHDEKWGAKA